MMKFLSALAITGVALTAAAQEQNALFPELKRIQAPNQQQAAAPEQQQAAPSSEQAGSNQAPVQEDTSLFAEANAQMEKQILEGLRQEVLTGGLADERGASLDANMAQANAGTSEPSPQERGFIVISPERVQIIEPSVKRFQFCMATVSLSNYTDFPITDFQAIIDYAPIPMPFNFGAVGVGQSKSTQFYLGGEACQQLIQIPKVQVQTCRATGVTEAECRSKVKYMTQLQLTSEKDY